MQQKGIMFLMANSMAMTKQDKAEMTGVFEAAFKNFKQIEILERELITQQLVRIEEKTVETCKKMDDISKAVSDHSNEIFQLKLPHNVGSCPQKKVIDTLYNSHQQNLGASKWKTAMWAIVVSLVSALATVVATFEFFIKKT